MGVEGVEAEGRTVSEATERALTLLGLSAHQVTIEVLSQGRPRLLGFGGEPARVRVTPLAESEPAGARPVAEEEPVGEEPQPAELLRPPALDLPVRDEDVEKAVTVLQDLLQLMGVQADVTPRKPETAGDGLGLIQTVLDITGPDLGILIGRRGTTLSSLQYVLNLILSRQLTEKIVVGIDVDGYRRRREQTLVSLARRMADRVRGTGRSVTLEPMPASERRIVHLTLANDPAVMTVSIGEGEARKVAITPSK
jgi:spoIIIJ-associated protein